MKNYPKPGHPKLGGNRLSLFGTRALDLPRYYAFQPPVAAKLFRAAPCSALSSPARGECAVADYPLVKIRKTVNRR